MKSGGTFQAGDAHHIVKRNAGLSFTPEQWQVVYGSILGDGNLCKPNTGINHHLTIAHGERQFEYLAWKRSLLAPLTSKINTYRRLDPRYGRVYVTSRFHTPSLSCLTELQAECYTGTKKHLPLSLLQRCEALAVAVWFMDDGSSDGDVPHFATVCFSAEDVEQACQWFQDRWQINAERSSSNRITIKGPSRNTFRALIEPHIPACMAYKLPALFGRPRKPQARREELYEEVACLACGAAFTRSKRDWKRRACSQSCGKKLIWKARRGEIPAMHRL